MSSLNYMELCRLCLVKERVSIPIFEGEGDVRQIFLKIASCLPVKVARDDKLPKKICDECMFKLDSAYQFYNTTANAEKQLLQWLGEIASEDKKSVPSNTIETEQLVLKEEAVEQDQGTELAKNLSRVETVLADDDRGVSEEEEEESDSDDEGSNSEDSGDDDRGEPPGKEEAESEDEPYEPLEPTTFVNVSLAGCDEAGPSGIQQQQPPPLVPAPAASGQPAGSATQQAQPSTQPTPFLAPGAPSTSTSATAAAAASAGAPSASAAPASASGSLRSTIWILDPSSAEVVPATFMQPGLSSPDSVALRLPTDPILVDTAQVDHRTPSFSSETIIDPTSSALPSNIDTSLAPSNAHSDNSANAPDCLSLTNLHLPSIRSQSEIDAKPVVSLQEGNAGPSSASADLSAPSNTRKVYECKICNRVLRNIRNYELHLQAHKTEKFTCPQCNKAYNGRHRLKQHMISHSQIKPFGCDTCGKSFRTKSQMTAHKNRHTKSKEFVCDVCGYAALEKSAIEIHRKRHSQEYNYKCDVCGKGCYTNAELRAHGEIHLGKVFQCKTCGRTFSNKNSLQCHMKLHDPEKKKKRLLCDICGASCAHPSDLQRHKTKHGITPRSVCDVCGKSFGSKYSLNVHNRIHTGEKPYSCDVCSKGFLSRPSMSVHMLTHTGEKPHRCTECGKCFTQRSSLVVHMRYHTGQRPFKCDLCDKDFVTRTLMNTHQKKAH